MDYSNIKVDDLLHSGILGMKWGVQNGPPYPLDDEDHSASEKKAGWRKSLKGGSIEKKGSKANPINKIKSKIDSKKEKKKAEERKQAAIARLEKARAAKAEKEKLQKEKEEIIRTGNISFVSEHINSFSNEEIDQVIARYQLNKKVSDLIGPSKKNQVKDKINYFINNSGNIATKIENGTRLYNSVAKISNGLGKTNLPIIGEKKQDDQINITETYDENKKLTNKSTTKRSGSSSYTKIERF